MAVQATTILASLLDLAALSAEVAILLKRANSGEEITDDEWAAMRARLADADDAWEQA